MQKNGLNISLLATLPKAQQQAILAQLTDSEAQQLLYDWAFMARPKQLPPDGLWSVWMILAGRGFGKTRTGAETVRAWIESGTCKRVALVARTAADVRDVMVEGESGLLAICPPWFKPTYEPSKRRLTWPNGAIATTYSGDKPDQLRGPQHDGAWCDELAAWRYPDAWDQLQFGLRLGNHPRVVVTTTPRPIKIVREILAEPTTIVTRGSTYENAANLAPPALARLKAKYENTRLGQQELFAVLLEDNPFALWKRADIDNHRVTQFPELKRVVVAIDPAATANEDSDETGIVIGGVGKDGHGYILDDMTLSASPDKWAKEAVTAYHKYKADRIVAEVNNGGDMVELTIRTVDKDAAYKSVRASRGKQTRAEPVAALYEQGKVHHVGMFAELEDQMCQWMPGEDSPDRMDALVWLLTELMLEDAENQVTSIGSLKRVNGKWVKQVSSIEHD
jgi:phage terminase large subunit-like protein